MNTIETNDKVVFYTPNGMPMSTLFLVQGAKIPVGHIGRYDIEHDGIIIASTDKHHPFLGSKPEPIQEMFLCIKDFSTDTKMYGLAFVKGRTYKRTNQQYDLFTSEIGEKHCMTYDQRKGYLTPVGYKVNNY
tara:strand:+ start:16124 stop:16519 length:396 start_codon:yes stop_codon:yes gene_type:complete